MCGCLGHDPSSPGLVVVRFGADLRGAVIDLTRRGRKLIHGGFAECGHFLAELLLPRGGVRERDEVSCPFIQFGECRPGFRLCDVMTNLQKNLFKSVLLVTSP